MAPFDPVLFLHGLSPVLRKPHDEVDRLLHSDLQANYNNPNITEDHLLRRLEALYRKGNLGLSVAEGRKLEPETAQILAHPAAGDRLAAYAAFVPKANGVFYQSSQKGLSRVKDPAILDAAIEHVNAGRFPHRAFAEEDPIYQTLRNIQENPNLTAEQEKKMLLGRHGDLAVRDAKHPEAVNAFARRQIARGDAPDGLLSDQLLEHPLLDPSILEEVKNAAPEYLQNRQWINAVAQRHPEAERLLRESAEELSRNTASILTHATQQSPKLKDNAEWHHFLLSHPNTQLAAVGEWLGTKQQIQHIAQTSQDPDVLKQLVRKQHPHVDDETINAIFSRSDLGAGKRLGAMRGIARTALREHVAKRTLGEKALLATLRHSGPEHLSDIGYDNGGPITKWMPNSVANAIAEAGDGDELKNWKQASAAHPGLTRENQLKLLPTYPHALRDNPNAHPDVISGLLKPDDDDMERGLRIRRLINHPNFGEQHIEQLRAQDDFRKSHGVYGDVLSKTTNPQFIREAFDKVKDLPQEKGDYGPGTGVLKAILGNTRVQIPDDILLHGVKHPNYQVAEAALRRTEQRHFDDIVERHPDHVAKYTNDPRHLEQLIGHSDERVRKTVYDNPHTSVDLLRKAHDSIKAKAAEAAQIDDGTGRNYRHGALVNEANGLWNRIAALDPDSVLSQKVGVRFDTGKLRQVRDILEEKGVQELRLKDLPEKLAHAIKASKAGLNPKNGNVSLQLLQQHIDNQPATRYNVSHSDWAGVQRHSNEPSKVFQLNVTTDHVRQMQQAGVYDTFRKLQDKFRGHPITDTAFGWVRWTGQPGINPGDGVFVDETQSDHTVPIAEKAYARKYKESIENGMHPDEAKEAAKLSFDNANAQYPAEHQKKINEILFGKKHSSQVLLEAFQQHLRDEGWAGTKIAIHSVHSKAPISLGNVKRGPDGKVDKKALPGHFIEGYENVPKSMGMQDSEYSKDNMATQSSLGLQGVPTHQETLRKKEENAIFQWVAMVKAEIDDDFGPEVEVKLPEFAVWAEYSKRKHD